MWGAGWDAADDRCHKQWPLSLENNQGRTGTGHLSVLYPSCQSSQWKSISKGKLGKEGVNDISFNWELGLFKGYRQKKSTISPPNQESVKLYWCLFWELGLFKGYRQKKSTISPLNQESVKLYWCLLFHFQDLGMEYLFYYFSDVNIETLMKAKSKQTFDWKQKYQYAPSTYCWYRRRQF